MSLPFVTACGFLCFKHDINLDQIDAIVKKMRTMEFDSDVGAVQFDLIQLGHYQIISLSGIAEEIGCTTAMLRDVLVIMRNFRINGPQIQQEAEAIKVAIKKLTPKDYQRIAKKSNTDPAIVKSVAYALLLLKKVNY